MSQLLFPHKSVRVIAVPDGDQFRPAELDLDADGKISFDLPGVDPSRRFSTKLEARAYAADAHAGTREDPSPRLFTWAGACLAASLVIFASFSSGPGLTVAIPMALAGCVFLIAGLRGEG